MKTVKQICARAQEVILLPAIGAVLVVGCSQSGKDTPGATPATTPKQAATQLEQAFASSPVETKTAATTASQALQTADYERAAQAFEAIKARKDLTVEQTMAIHESEAAMMLRLAVAAESGDARAKQALEALKRRHRN